MQETKQNEVMEKREALSWPAELFSMAQYMLCYDSLLPLNTNRVTRQNKLCA